MAKEQDQQRRQQAADKSPETTPPKDTPDAPPPADGGDIATSEDKQEEAAQATTEAREARKDAPTAAPLAPDQGTQLSPRLGNPGSSTNPVAAAAALRSQPGTGHVQFVSEDGTALSPDDIFVDEGGPTVTAKTRVHEVYRYRNATSHGVQLLYTPGQLVPRREADQVLAAARAVEEQQQG